MRIAQVANFYGPGSGGIRTTMHQLGLGYRAYGWESFLIVPGDRHSHTPTPYGTVITLPSRPIPGSGGYRVITDVDLVCAVLDEIRPTRLEVADRLSLRGLGWWALSADVPSVMWAHERLDRVLDTWLPGPWPSRRIADHWNRATARRFDAIACSTAFAREEFDRIGTRSVVQVPLGVDLDVFTPNRRDESLRDELLDGEELLIVMCSRLAREKQPQVAVRAVAELAAAGLRPRLVVVGSGPLEQRLRDMSFGLPVTFLGFVSERERLARVLASADVAIAPGPIETFGLAALEALASGTPVVANANSALREIVTETAGRLTEGGPMEIAAAVAELVCEPHLIRQRGARQRASEFPWSRTVDRMIGVHRSFEGPDLRARA